MFLRGWYEAAHAAGGTRAALPAFAVGAHTLIWAGLFYGCPNHSSGGARRASCRPAEGCAPGGRGTPRSALPSPGCSPHTPSPACRPWNSCARGWGTRRPKSSPWSAGCPRRCARRCSGRPGWRSCEEAKNVGEFLSPFFHGVCVCVVGTVLPPRREVERGWFLDGNKKQKTVSF